MTSKGENKKLKRTFKLHEFRGGPKSGGSYSGTPVQAAKKAANRWVCPKDVYDQKTKFSLRETTRRTRTENKIYEFTAKRTKLATPKTYKRGDTEIVVDSKIEIL